MPGGREALIDHKSVDHVKKTLGAMTSPNRDSSASLSLINKKAVNWINTVRNGHIHRRNILFSMKVQFWPRVGYELCNSTALFNNLEECLHKQYYQILPHCGVVRTTPIGSRALDAGFFGIGLPHLGAEALVAMSNKILMHYGCNTATGRFMQVSYHLFYLELGLSFCPMQESYQEFGHLAMHSWMKSFWEKLSFFNIEALFAGVTPHFLQEGNQFIMQVLIRAGYKGETLRRLNKARISQKVLLVRYSQGLWVEE